MHGHKFHSHTGGKEDILSVRPGGFQLEFFLVSENEFPPWIVVNF